MGVLAGETGNFAWGQPKMRPQAVTLELGVKDMQGVSQWGKRGSTAFQVDRTVGAGGSKGAPKARLNGEGVCSVWLDARCRAGVWPLLLGRHAILRPVTHPLPPPTPTAPTKSSLISAGLGVRRPRL